jgi:hypothetical protein
VACEPQYGYIWYVVLIYVYVIRWPLFVIGYGLGMWRPCSIWDEVYRPGAPAFRLWGLKGGNVIWMGTAQWRRKGNMKLNPHMLILFTTGRLVVSLMLLIICPGRAALTSAQEIGSVPQSAWMRQWRGASLPSTGIQLRCRANLLTELCSNVCYLSVVLL